MLNALTAIGGKINDQKITWGLGGSLLLSFYNLEDNPNDIDILVEENSTYKLNQMLSTIGQCKEAVSSDPFRTTSFSKYLIENMDVDVMGGFAIQHHEGIYKIAFNTHSIVDSKTINGVSIPLCSLEDWYILYWLIPNKQYKALLIEDFLKKTGVKHPEIFKQALNQPLPFEVKERVRALL
ncbi:hypothetical protein J27TS8_22970 [Robertmurraya siralis]|uniref:Uncharacterized protein n=1 Tax=Robertmurraya siralis TaxID=77777 RepID=A0A919WID3_9BACI|nr:hypothetical protein [Robertmurraya siralis]PAE20359.1 hypothetical protein CHH80_12275 [Bacillus sp. 7504-2]GIN62304.1 hypothetical protein J27TS8_22970 [Robertmurraya siralis]